VLTFCINLVSGGWQFFFDFWQLFQGKTYYDHDFVGFHEHFLVTGKGKCNDQGAGRVLSLNRESSRARETSCIARDLCAEDINDPAQLPIFRPIRQTPESPPTLRQISTRHEGDSRASSMVLTSCCRYCAGVDSTILCE